MAYLHDSMECSGAVYRLDKVPLQALLPGDGVDEEASRVLL